MKLPAPTEIRDYLRYRGWSQLDEAVKHDRLYALTNPAYERRQIIFPIDGDVPDFSETLLLAITKIADIENVAVDRLIATIVGLRSDTLRFSIVTNRDESLVLPLSFASEAIASAEQMLLSAACTVIAPRIHHPRLARTEAQMLLKASQFGHTEEGSFVFKVSCPLDDPSTQLSLGDDLADSNFTRRTTETIARSIDELVTAIETDALSRFVDEIKNEDRPQVSANFCEALANLHDESINNSVRFSVSWSLTRAVSDDLKKAREIKREYFPRIAEVHQELRKAEKPLESVFVGTVEELNGDMGADGRRYGEVVLSLISNEFDDTVRARTNLNADNYDKAHRAHKDADAFIQIKAKLQPGRQPRQLTDVVDFGIISDDDLLR